MPGIIPPKRMVLRGTPTAPPQPAGHVHLPEHPDVCIITEPNGVYHIADRATCKEPQP